MLQKIKFTKMQYVSVKDGSIREIPISNVFCNGVMPCQDEDEDEKLHGLNIGDPVRRAKGIRGMVLRFLRQKMGLQAHCRLKPQRIQHPFGCP